LEGGVPQNKAREAQKKASISESPREKWTLLTRMGPLAPPTGAISGLSGVPRSEVGHLSWNRGGRKRNDKIGQRASEEPVQGINMGRVGQQTLLPTGE